MDLAGNIALTDAAARAGAAVVLVSVLGASRHSPMRLFRMNYAAEGTPPAQCDTVDDHPARRLRRDLGADSRADSWTAWSTRRLRTWGQPVRVDPGRRSGRHGRPGCPRAGAKGPDHRRTRTRSAHPRPPRPRSDGGSRMAGRTATRPLRHPPPHSPASRPTRTDGQSLPGHGRPEHNLSTSRPRPGRGGNQRLGLRQITFARWRQRDRSATSQPMDAFILMPSATEYRELRSSMTSALRSGSASSWTIG